MLNKKRLFLLTLAVSLLSACVDSTGPTGDHVIGSGVLASKIVPIESFHAVEVRAVAFKAGDLRQNRVVITPGPAETVTVTADDNLLPLLLAQVRDGRLTVGTPDPEQIRISTENEILFEITYRQIDELEVQGVLDVDVDGLSTDDLNVVLSGVSRLTVEGRAERQVVQVDGVISYLASDLTSRFVTITGSGVMSVVVNVSDELKGDVCGVGTIQYVGAPEVSVTTCPAVSVSQLPSG